MTSNNCKGFCISAKKKSFCSLKTKQKKPIILDGFFLPSQKKYSFHLQITSRALWNLAKKSIYNIL